MPLKRLTPLLGIAFLLVCCVPSLAERPSLPCKTKLPLYVDKDNKPIWLDSKQLKEIAIHCEVPQIPTLAQRMRIGGRIVLEVLVNPSGNMECIKVMSGYPLLEGAAIEAAKKWRFKPLMMHGKTLAFCGILEFHIATEKSDHSPDPCLCAHT